MSIHVFIKDVDDFAKARITNNTAIYEQHYPRSKKGDIHIYYYPKTPSVGIYQVSEEIEFKIDHQEVWQYCKGKMNRVIRNDDVKATIDYLLSSDKPGVVKLATEIDEIIYDLQKKYNPELF